VVTNEKYGDLKQKKTRGYYDINQVITYKYFKYVRGNNVELKGA